MIYLIIVPIHQSKSDEIGDALIENVITKYCIPEYIIIDQGSAFMSSLLNYLFTKLDIKIDSPTLQSSITTGRTTINYPNIAFDQSRSYVAKILAISYICLQHISYP